jgi:small nuclear ribonucleoprotein (snRNP)-like protein
MYYAYVTPPDFRDDLELSATALQILWDNTYVLDSIANRNIFLQMTAREKYWTPSINPHRIWWGGLEFRTGLTTIHITVEAVTTTANETIRVYVNGSLVINTALLDGTNTYTGTISGLGLLDRQVVEVDVQAYFPTGVNGTSAEYLLLEAYCTPVSALNTLSWSDPTSLGTLTAANLNTYVNSQKYLANGLRMIPVPLGISPIVGGAHTTGEVTRLAHYVFYRTGGNDRIHGVINGASRQNVATEVFAVTSLATLANPSFGANSGFQTVIDASIAAHTLDTPYWLRIQENIGVGPPDWRGAVNTKYSATEFKTYSASYTGPTLPTQTSMMESMTFSTLQTRINTIRTALISVKAKMDANPVLFNRWPLMSRRPVLYDEHDSYYQNNYLFGKQREGDTLIIRGRNVRLCWGPIKVTNIDEFEYEYANEENLISNDKTETVRVNLEKYDIPRGTQYYVRGDYVIYAAEYFIY